MNGWVDEERRDRGEDGTRHGDDHERRTLGTLSAASDIIA